jgi:hypothetical protein
MEKMAGGRNARRVLRQPLASPRGMLHQPDAPDGAPRGCIADQSPPLAGGK